MISAELKERSSSVGKSDVIELVFNIQEQQKLPTYEKGFTVNRFFSLAGVRLYLNISSQKLYF